MTEAREREAICAIGASIFARGLTAGSSGNISARIEEGWLMTPTGSSLGRLDPARLSKLDHDGRLVSGDPPTKESFLHRVMYEERPRTGADDQSRRHVCYNSPVYRDLSRKVVKALAEHFQHNSNIIGWQIDNEINCEVSVCYSASCQTAFRKWLGAKYGTLDSLNQRWGNRFWSQWYTGWDQVDLPFPTPAWHNPALMLDYKRFISDSATSFVREQTDILRSYRPRDFITSNGVFKNINYYDFTRGMDIYAIDNYPCFIDEPQYPTGAGLTAVRGFTGRMMVMEQQTCCR